MGRGPWATCGTSTLPGGGPLLWPMVTAAPANQPLARHHRDLGAGRLRCQEQLLHGEGPRATPWPSPLPGYRGPEGRWPPAGPGLHHWCHRLPATSHPRSFVRLLVRKVTEAAPALRSQVASMHITARYSGGGGGGGGLDSTHAACRKAVIRRHERQGAAAGLHPGAGRLPLDTVGPRPRMDCIQRTSRVTTILVAHGPFSSSTHPHPSPRASQDQAESVDLANGSGCTTHPIHSLPPQPPAPVSCPLPPQPTDPGRERGSGHTFPHPRHPILHTVV